MARSNYLAILFGLCLPFGQVYAQTTLVGGGPKQLDESSELPQGSPRISELIGQLSSPVFNMRESAGAALLQIGHPAILQLREVTSSDFEVWFRANRIAKRIEDGRFEQLSRSFLLDRNPENSYGLPAWQKFADVVGTSRTSKLLFLDMIRQQPELSKLIDRIAQDQRVGSATERALQRLMAVASGQAARIVRRRHQLQYPEIGDLVAILMSTTLLENQAPVEINELLDSSVHIVPMSSYMQRRGYGPALRKLYSQWIPKTHESMAHRALYISLMNDLKTGAEVARRHLSRNYDPRTREQAILCLARFGNKSDVASLVNLFEDETVCGEFSRRDLPFLRQLGIDISDEPPPGAPRMPADNAEDVIWMAYRICDLATAAAIMLNGEEPESLFPRFMRDSRFGFESRTVAVRKTPAMQQQRREQINAWKSAYASRNRGS